MRPASSTPPSKSPPPATHTVKVWMVDPGITLQKLILNLGGLKGPTYLGPPETYHK